MPVYINEPRYLTAGESCVVAEFADEIDRGANDAVMDLKRYVTGQNEIPIIECLPTYRSLAVYFDPTVVSAEDVVRVARKAPISKKSDAGTAMTEISIPVCYGGEYGPDILNVAEHAGISEEDVIKKTQRQGMPLLHDRLHAGFCVSWRHGREHSDTQADKPAYCDKGRKCRDSRKTDRDIPDRQPGRMAAYRPDTAASVHA